MESRRDILNKLCRAAEECYPTEEARQIAEMVITELGGITINELIIESNAPIHIPNIEQICHDLSTWRPVQYITKRAYFADMELEVCEGVLIPRPETEELVEWVKHEKPHCRRILDVCTGSGAIAIALRRAIADSEVYAFDLSTEALDIALRNGARYAPDVRFFMADALSDFSEYGTFDVIISNPPYIPERDRELMRSNVVDYEPSMALFVPDDNPLLFYRAIARTSRKMLSDAGHLYFEIYETLADEMVEMLHKEGYCDITIREDFRGKPRMICAKVNSTTR